MSSQKYLCMYRGAPSTKKPSPSPAQMQEMFAAFNAWKEQFKANILDMGSKLKPTGKVVTASGVTDGPFAEAKEIVAGFMILTADDYDGAVAVVKAMPGMQMPGASVEIREMASF
jgi:hypothetical protein